jgi:hypothetical protein
MSCIVIYIKVRVFRAEGKDRLRANAKLERIRAGNLIFVRF